MAQSVSETGGCSRDIVLEVDSHDPVDQEEEKEVALMSSQLGDGSSLTNPSGNQVLGGDDKKKEKGGGKRCIDEESSLVAKKSLKPRRSRRLEIKEERLKINSRLPPEVLSAIFRFLPFGELKRALLVCRWEKIQITESLYI